MPHDNPEGWDRECGREIKRWRGFGDIGIYIADFLCYQAEIYTAL